MDENGVIISEKELLKAGRSALRIFGGALLTCFAGFLFIQARNAWMFRSEFEELKRIVAEDQVTDSTANARSLANQQQIMNYMELKFESLSEDVHDLKTDVEVVIDRQAMTNVEVKENTRRIIELYKRDQ